MQPGPYEIPAAIQKDLLQIAHSMGQFANRPRRPLSPRQREALQTIADRCTMLGTYPFENGNMLVLTKPDYTFAYVRHGCDQILGVLDGATPPSWNSALRVRDWLDAIGHRYPEQVST